MKNLFCDLAPRCYFEHNLPNEVIILMVSSELRLIPCDIGEKYFHPHMLFVWHCVFETVKV